MTNPSADYDAHRYPGVPIPADWLCAFVACGQRADQPHVEGCPYGDCQEGKVSIAPEAFEAPRQPPPDHFPRVIPPAVTPAPEASA